MWTGNDLNNALGIAVRRDEIFTGVRIDSRTEGEIFIGIKGPNHDGGNFSKQAIENGAKLCLVSSIPEDCLSYQNKFVVVDDTYKNGLLKLAIYNRDVKYANSFFIGVTGSVGKTTVKEMLRIAFEKLLGKVYCSEGNKNNHYGLPLSMANMYDVSCGVFELGMSSPGEISYLSRILKPHISIITSIAPAHMEYFSGLEAIAEAKGEIIDGMQEGGVLIINLDSPHVDKILSITRDKGIKTFGYSTRRKNVYKTDFIVTLEKAEIIQSDDGEICTRVILKGQDDALITYIIGYVGEEFILNSMAVFSTLLSYSTDNKLEILEAMKSLRNFKGLKGRGEAIFFPKNQIKLIDDSYNANPMSVEASIKRLKKIADCSECKRTIAVLGDMLELGEDELKMHRDLLSIIETNGIDKVFCVGERMKELFDILPTEKQGLWFNTSNEMAEAIVKFLQPGDYVMVKGSLSMKMSIICQTLMNNFH